MQLHQTIEKMARRDSLIHSRLALLQLISEVAEAFQEERITASHANLSHSYRRGP
jgi:ParB family chromosome partitioning protein